MGRSMGVELRSAQRVLFRGQAKSVLVPAQEGQLCVYAMHMPLVCILRQGVVQLVDEQEKTHSFAIENGLMETFANQTTVLVVESSAQKEMK